VDRTGAWSSPMGNGRALRDGTCFGTRPHPDSAKERQWERRETGRSAMADPSLVRSPQRRARAAGRLRETPNGAHLGPRVRTEILRQVSRPVTQTTGFRQRKPAGSGANQSDQGRESVRLRTKSIPRIEAPPPLDNARRDRHTERSCRLRGRNEPLKGKPQRCHRHETRPERLREEKSVKRLRKPEGAA